VQYYEGVWQTALSPLSIFFFISFKKSNQIYIYIFYFLYYINNFFIIIQIKKIHYKTKLFHFSIMQFQTFLYFILHQLLFITI
jgi:hypothetical protein